MGARGKGDAKKGKKRVVAGVSVPWQADSQIPDNSMFQVSPLAKVRQVPGDGSGSGDLSDAEADLVAEIDAAKRAVGAKAPHGFVMMASLRLSDALMWIAHRLEDAASRLAEFGWLHG